MPAPTWVGRVVSIRASKTISVLVNRYARHKRYPQIIRTTKKFATHDPAEKAGLGDIVKIKLGRPVSKTKSFHLVDVVRKNPL